MPAFAGELMSSKSTPGMSSEDGAAESIDASPFALILWLSSGISESSDTLLRLFPVIGECAVPLPLAPVAEESSQHQ